MDKIIQLLSKIKNPFIRIVAIVLICALIGIGLSTSVTGCAHTTSFDSLNIDNFSTTTRFPGKQQ